MMSELYQNIYLINKESSKIRFFSKVTITESCWIWNGSLDQKGYGVVKIGIGPNGKMIRAHRLSILIRDEKLEKLLLCHHCDNKICVNPNHLFYGTNKDNMRDKVLKDRAAMKLTRKEVLEIRELYKSGKYTHKRLGELFGVTKTNIGYIVRNIIWNHF